MLCKKSSVSLQHFDSSIGSNTDLSQHAFFADTTCPSALQHLVTLYTEKNFTLWKDPQVFFKSLLLLLLLLLLLSVVVAVVIVIHCAGWSVAKKECVECY